MAKPNEVSRATRLDGAWVLVVEDEFLIGLELAAILSDAGAQVVGPSRTLKEALAAVDHESISAAILDIRLGNDSIEPVARRLAARGIPFVFYTGQTKTDPVRTEWPDSGVISKPALPNTLIAAVAAMSNDACHPRSALRERAGRSTEP